MLSAGTCRILLNPSRRLLQYRHSRQVYTSEACSVSLLSRLQATYLAQRPSSITFTRPLSTASTSADQPNNDRREKGGVNTGTTERILKQKTGSMSKHDWTEANDALRWWAQRRASKGALDSVWALLDRVVQEEMSDSSVESELSTDWLNIVVGAWRANASDLLPLTLTPNDVLKKLDEYAPTLLPDPRTYHMIVNAAISLDPSTAPDFCRSIIDRMNEEAEFNPQVRPDEGMRSILLHAYANSKIPKAAQLAEAELQRMKAIGGDMAPTINSYVAVITAWARSGDKDAPRRAEALLLEMDQSTSTNAYPNTTAFSAVLNAWSKSNEPGAARRAESILNHMESLYKGGNEHLKPSEVCHIIVINAYARAGQPQEAERLLKNFEAIYELTGDAAFRPTSGLYTTVIHSWYLSNHPHAAERADALLKRTQQLAEEWGDDNLLPYTMTFTLVLGCLVKSGKKGSWERANAIFHEMDDLYEKGYAAAKPNGHAIAALLGCSTLSNDGGINTLKRIDALVDRLFEVYNEGDDKGRAETKGFNAALNAYARCAKENPQAPERAESLLQNMGRLFKDGYEHVKPDLHSYSSVTNAWLWSGRKDALKRMEKVLQYMLRLSPDLRPNKYHYTSLIRAWGQSGKKDAPKRIEAILRHMTELSSAGERHLKPETYQYNFLISAWANIGHVAAAESVLERMEREASQGNEDVRPNTISYNFVIAAYARSQDQSAAVKVDSLVLRMQKLHESGDPNVKPDVFTFTSVISAFSKRRDPRGAEKAMRYLKYMNDAHAGGHKDCKPNVVTYTAALSTWRFSKDPNAVDRACDLLGDMREHNVEPNVKTYGALLKVIADSGLPDKAERAQKVLQDMKDELIDPNIPLLNCVLEACAFVGDGDEQKRRALRIAVDTLDFIHNSKDLQPDITTYLKFFKAYDNEIEEYERSIALQKGYERCCDNGFGDHPSVKRLVEKFQLETDASSGI